MGNTNAAQEPSMEEILASIRQIISEEGAPDVYENDHKNDGPKNGTSLGGASIRVAEKAPDNPAMAPGGSMKSNGAGPARNADRGAAMSAPHEAAPAPRAQDTGETRLLSNGADQAVSTSFSTLAHTILAQNARTLEDLVSEMLQPMLQEWLDDNLPTLVERIVQEEIQRVSRGRR